jgi:CheY-like chemotaxis protein
VEERRRHERYSVAWPVRVWLREHTFLAGRTVDASIHGARVLLDRLPAGILELNDVCGLTIRPGGPDELNCVAVVRDLGNHYGVGLEVKDELPIPFGAPRIVGRPADASAAGAPLVGTILVVDDQPSRRRLLGDYLMSEGYRVVPASPDVETVLQAAQRWRPDLILLDMGLTEADPLEVLRRIHREEPAIGVVILTGNRELALARLGFELGATDCLFKPFDLNRLGRAVRSSLALSRHDGG